MTSAIYFLILALLAILIFVIATKTDMLRDPIVNTDKFNSDATIQNLKEPKAPFSLVRSQLAFWTVIIVSSFLYVLFKAKFTIPELNNTNLILLGMAVGTSAAGKIIDDSQKQNEDRSQDHPSHSFFVDILSDKNGVSIHRLQNVIWTLIVGMIYIQFVAKGGSLPDETVITTQLLTLMGISTTAFVGIKATENSK